MAQQNPRDSNHDGGERDQEALFAFMGDPSNYDPPPEEVRRVDTHGAAVFLAGDTAYKIKRAVKLPYLDFSTLKKRRAACEREIEINQPGAPRIYQGVVPIVARPGGGFAIDAPGEPVEWAVKMRRFDEAGLFDRLAENGALDPALMAPLARKVAEQHRQAPAVRTRGGTAIMEGVVAPLMESLADMPPLVRRDAVAALARATRAALKAHAGLLDDRAARGYVRRCHGDLHLRNIVLDDGAPVLFDAIEFDETIATIDVLYDLAFLLMDLWRRGLTGHANALFNHYLRAMDDAEPRVQLRGLALLPLFLSVRAAVRAVVTHDRMEQVSGDETCAAESELRAFFDLARDLLQPASPRLVAVGGLSGTGKSTLAAALAPDIGAAPGALVVRSDVERKRLAGVAETEKLGPAHYTAAATGRVYRAMHGKAETALRAGHAVILDAVYARPDQRRRAREIAREAGVPFTGLWLEAASAELIARVEARSGDASDADTKVVRKQLDYETGRIGWARVDAGGMPEAVQARARRVLGQG